MRFSLKPASGRFVSLSVLIANDKKSDFISRFFTPKRRKKIGRQYSKSFPANMRFNILLISIPCLILVSSAFDAFNQFEFVTDNSLSRNIDDGTCNSQLSLFSDALRKREMWALRCKILKFEKSS